MSVSGHWQEGAAYEKLAVQLAFIGQYHLLDEEFLLPPVTNNMGLYETGWSEHSHPARLEVLSRPGGILDHEQRRRAWWSIFQLERFNGMAMGRPPIIKPGWHWVWLPCSEELWAQDNPSGPLAWEMGLADFSQRPNSSVSNCRVDLILSLVMGQLLEQRTEMFRLFFPRVDRGTLFYDNLPTHSLGWTMRLRRLIEVVGSLERRIRQWHAELDRYADTFSARRHANFEMVGASCQIHLYACVLQIREHLFEDLLVNEEVNKASSVRTGPHTEQGSTGATTPANGSVPAAKDETLKQNGISDTAANSRELDFDLPSSRNSSVDLSAAFERHTGMPFERSTYQRGYMAKAKRPELTLQFVSDLDTLAQRCWDRSVAMADEIARLLRVHWLKPFDSAAGPSAGDLSGFVASSVNPGKSYDHQVGGAKLAAWTLGDNNSGNTKGPQAPSGADARRPSSVSGSSVVVSSLDPDIADRFKLMNPQTPYHLFVAGKVQAARLKQAVTAQDRKRQRQGKQSDEDAEMEDTEAPAAEPKDNEDLVVEDAIRRINEIWDSQALTADVTAIEGRLDDIVSALDYCQLFWYSLNFASHLRYLKREAMKPLLHSVYRS
ncbi:hypothetical protein FBU59_004255 [Linderina macrospora]|uniref:Uncharacterized protein n=1 Tax=Linderina macrospora TaxID=4868 RepID=A0ACC1J6B6_9FUNG|nr:hypothetical protein FBU59_004255 [Linderina macrospora]